MVAFDTGFPADSLEFCPSQAANDIFVCGTYKLDEDNFSPENQRFTLQHRRGQCLVFQVSSAVNASSEIQYRKLQELDLPAVLDMKWCHTQDDIPPILAIADSEGNVTLHKLSTTERRLSQVERIQCTSPDVLCLSLDWSNRLSPRSAPGSLVVSLSNGSICILRPTGASLALTETWHAHDHEPWITAWDYWDTNVIYSGGDDLKLKAWDVRCSFDSPTFVNRRFEAGVTSIQSSPHVEHLIAVGSYNNSVQLFDARKPLIPLTYADVGGGAWRVKWHPSIDRKRDLLVASMHDGFKVVTYNSNTLNNGLQAGSDGRIVQRYDEHTSLAYGVDWSFAPSTGHNTIIGSCSFYDHTLHLWRG